MLDASVLTALPAQKREPDIVIELPGAVRGKGRPRARIASSKAGHQFVAVYTDKETRSYEAMLRYAGEHATKKAGIVRPLEDALRVRVTAVFAVPMSRSKKATAEALAGIIRPTGKPDGDNILKCVGDALNAVVWRDDAVVVEWVVRKFFGERPTLLIEVWRHTGLLL